jgi:hypothetical protein
METKQKELLNSFLQISENFKKFLSLIEGKYAPNTLRLQFNDIVVSEVKKNLDKDFFLFMTSNHCQYTQEYMYFGSFGEIRSILRLKKERLNLPRNMGQGYLLYNIKEDRREEEIS